MNAPTLNELKSSMGICKIENTTNQEKRKWNIKGCNRKQALTLRKTFLI